MGKWGAIVVPAHLRRRFGIEEGSLVMAEARDDGIPIRPALVVPVEVYSPERRAAYLDVKAMGLDPDQIPHHKPGRGRR